MSAVGSHLKSFVGKTTKPELNIHGNRWYVYTPQKYQMWVATWREAMGYANHYAREAQREACGGVGV